MPALLGRCGGALDNLEKEDLYGKYTVPEGDCAYTVPEGCIVRNTFLEWQDHDTDGNTRVGESTVCPQKATQPRRRARSCPVKVRRSSAAARTQPGTGGYCEQRPMQQYSMPDLSVDGSDGFDNTPIPMRGCSLSADDVTAMVCGAMTGGMGYGFYHPADAGELYAASLEMQHPQEFMDGQQEEPMWYGGGWIPQPSPTTVGVSTVDDWSPGSSDSTGQQETVQDSQQGQGDATDDVPLMLRGLPYTATEADLFSFLEEAGVADCLAEGPGAISLLSNPRGKPSGFAELRLSQHTNFWEVQEKLHMRRLGGRYIEALPPRSGKTTWGAVPSWKRLPAAARPHHAKRAPHRRF